VAAAGGGGVTKRRALALAAVWTLPSLFFLTVVWWEYSTWRIDVPAPLGDAARADVVKTLRTALEGGGVAAPAHPELRRGLGGNGPVAATVYLEGKQIGRVDGYAGTVAAATAEAARLFEQHPAIKQLTPADRAAATLKVDVVVGRGPIERDHPLLQLAAMHPGIEGLGVALPGATKVPDQLIMPDEMFLLGLLAKRPLTRMMPEVGMGVEFEKADQILAARMINTNEEWKARPRRYYRFRTDAFVEAPDRTKPPLQLTRGVPPGPPPTPENLKAAALEGARYLIAHLAPNGRYIYEQNLVTGVGTDPMKAGTAYSLPRHCGTTYFLAEIYRITKEEWLREPIERAFGHMNELVKAGGCTGDLPDGTPFACVIDRGQSTANLGSTALGVVALAEYQRATGDTRYLELATRLSNWMLWMQRDDGSFRHLYNVRTRIPDDKTMLLYFSGEAALALARMYTVTGDERYAKGAEKALNWLVGWYDFFIGGMLYGEEHWTCIASEALWPYAKNPEWLDFCNGLSRFWRMGQPHPGERPDQEDLVGSHNVTPFVMPQNTPSGSHSEAQISTYLLGRYHKRPNATMRRHILETLGYLLRQQVRPGNDYAVVKSAKGQGAFPGNPVDRVVRIDYVQHVCSAFIRGVELAEEEAGGGSRSETSSGQ
jgi:hypothetical protein